LNKIKVKISDHIVGDLFFDKIKNEYIFNYTKDTKPISLIMPFRNSSYIYKYSLHPIFDMNMPEGYLFELLKQYISKEHGYIDDFLLFSYICSNIQSRLTFDSWIDSKDFISYDIDYILQNDNQDTFSMLINTYLSKNAISGVQPKSLALLKDKETLTTNEYIIKTWGDEYPQLSLNEYFCLKAIQNTGVLIPDIKLSKNNKFLIVKRFNYDENTNTYLGFEEILTLMGKNKDKKYSGSYEQIAKIVYSVTTNKKDSMIQLYKLIVMNYLLKNGDAHLKNFGILYNESLDNIYLSPAYDVVTTTAYYYKDKPALTLNGKKLWAGKKELINFAQESCYISKKEAIDIYELCINTLKNSIKELEIYITKNKEFENIGLKMLDSWKVSLTEKSIKEIPNEITRNWT
jgi:serine/threonine-protein kinase HipA